MSQGLEGVTSAAMFHQRQRLTAERTLNWLGSTPSWPVASQSARTKAASAWPERTSWASWMKGVSAMITCRLHSALPPLQDKHLFGCMQSCALQLWTVNAVWCSV